MYKIQTLNKIAQKGLDILPRDNYETASEIMNPDAILVRSFNMHEMEILPSVKAIARAGSGVNNIPVDKCSERGIVVFNTPGANANGVKELTLTALFITSRNVLPAVEWAKTLIGKGDEVPRLIEKGKSNFAGTELKGKTLGVVGLGAIGVMVANSAIDLGMKVIGYDPYISIEAAWGLNTKVTRAPGFEKLLSESDYITLHVPLNDSTRGLMNHEKFSVMKKGAKLLNFSRGGLVNNKDLKNAISDKTVSTYITDFPDEELLQTENVICIPHLGASTAEAEENCARMAATQLRNFLEKGNIKNSVNFPDTEADYQPDTSRIIIANRNIPAMVGQITSVMADKNINISQIVNKHKNGLAYNIIDTDNPIDDELIKRISGIEGIIMVRQLPANEA